MPKKGSQHYSISLVSKSTQYVEPVLLARSPYVPKDISCGKLCFSIAMVYRHTPFPWPWNLAVLLETLATLISRM